MSDASAALYAPDGTFLSPLTTQHTLQWQEALNEPGSGSFSMPLDDPDSALVVAGSEVRCSLYGTVVFTFIIDKDPKREAIANNEEAGQDISATGKGRADIFSSARVYPYKGVGQQTMSQSRLYTFASPDFPNLDDWGSAVQINLQSYVDPVRYSVVEYVGVASDSGDQDSLETVHAAAPLGWLDPNAWWIWGTPDPMDVGKCYFRREFTLDAETAVVVACTADDHYTLYLDGTPILGDQGEPGDTWNEHKRVEIILPAGTYMLAAIAENQDRPGISPTDNPAALLCSVYTVDADDKLASVIVHTDDSWSCLSYPAYVPGWTPGQIVIDAIDEAQTRGGLAGWAGSFAALTDSAGADWDGAAGAGPYVPGFSIPIGGTVLDIIAGLVDQGWVDYHVQPEAKLLDMWNAKGGAAHTGVVLANTGVVATSNILSLSFDPQTAPTTRLLVKWSMGFFAIEDADAIAAHGVHEGYVTIDATTQAEAQRQAQLTLDDLKNPVTALVIDTDPALTGDQPYVNYRAGDYLYAPNEAGTSTEYRLHGMTISLQDSGKVTIALEMNSRILTAEREQFKLYSVLGRGVTGNTKIRNALNQTTQSSSSA